MKRLAAHAGRRARRRRRRRPRWPRPGCRRRTCAGHARARSRSPSSSTSSTAASCPRRCASRWEPRSASWCATTTRSTTSSSSAQPDVHARHRNGTEAEHPPRPGELSVGPDEQGVTTYRFDDPGVGRDRLPPARPLRLRHARRGRGRRAHLASPRDVAPSSRRGHSRPRSHRRRRTRWHRRCQRGG